MHSHQCDCTLPQGALAATPMPKKTYTAVFFYCLVEGNTGNLLRSFTASLTAQSDALVRGSNGLPSVI